MKRRVLLIGWDAADWKVLNPLLERGAMPAFARLVDQGVIADMSTLEPVLSPMLWSSIATGMRADQHGILGFTEVDPESGRVRPVTSTLRRTKALWNILSQEGYRVNVAGWFASHPAEPIRGACVSDAYARGFPLSQDAPWPLMAGTVYPDSLSPILEKLRLRPQEIDEEIFRLFIPRLEAIDRSKPNGLATLAKILAECFSIHTAATWLMENRDWDFMGVYYIGIDHFSHGFMNFHPPRLSWIPEEEYELYKDIVNGAYRLMDLFLARLMQLAGPETTVLIASDHGFHSDHLRPRLIADIPAGPAAQHRPLGIFAMAGEGVRRDERIYGVNLLDVAPTVLSLFGLPAGADMPGRVIAEAFEEMPNLERIPSWDAVEGESGMHAPGTEAGLDDSDESSRALLEQFVALGYIDPQPPEATLAAENCERERLWNLARVFTSTGRFPEALPMLEQLCAGSPARNDFALALADCQLRVGLFEEAEASARSALREDRETPVAHYVISRIAQERGAFRESLDHLLAAEKSARPSAELWVRIGFAHLRLRLWDDAERAYKKALELDPHRALAWQGLARVHFRRRRYEEAAQYALDSIACRHDLPLSHLLLGLALVRLGERERAVQAFETSLSFHPDLPVSHRMLASLRGNTQEGRRHMTAARQVRHKMAEEQRRLDGVRQEARHRAMDRASQLQPPPDERLEFIVVSGLPRSGTSLMMQMLAAAGVPVMSDGERSADEDNPEGYLEWEAIKSVGAQPGILRQASGKAIKIISMLLPVLPARHRYKVVFMDRPAAEIAASQRKMMERRGTAAGATSVAEAERMLLDHRNATLQGLRTTSCFELLMVDYPDLVRSPKEWVDRIEAFIGPLPNPEAMLRVVRPELHRNRAAKPDSV